MYTLSNLCLKFEHTVFRSPSAHHQSSFQRHRDPREHIRGPKGPVEGGAGRRFLSNFVAKRKKNHNAVRNVFWEKVQNYNIGAKSLNSQMSSILTHLKPLVQIWHHVFWILGDCKSVIKSFLKFCFVLFASVRVFILHSFLFHHSL